MNRSSLALLVSLAGTALVFGQQDFSNVQIKTTHVAGNVYMLEGAGGNIGVSVGSDGLLIVDDQFAPLAAKIETALHALDKGPLKFVLNTHWHGDHTGGNPHFGKEATIIAQTNVRKRLEEKSGTPKEALPVVTFDQSLAVHFNGEEVKVLHVPPGHTDGDSVIYFSRSGVAHMGDQFFNGGFPFIDLNSGGDVRGYIKNVELALERLPQGVKIIPGHGPLGDRADLERFHEMLVATAGIVRDGIAGGKTLEEIKAAGLPDKWSGWGKGFVNTERWLETLYKGLSN